MRYDEIIGTLRQAYDAKVDERSSGHDAEWKEAEREAFLARLRAAGASTLLEIGAGTGIHGRWFADRGLDVVCTDLSPAMVEHCRSIGLEAHVQDFLSLDLGRTFDAVFAMNCLLHVPHAEIDAVLRSIASCVRPGGLLFWGQYGGEDREGPLPDDHYEPKRFFSSFTDEQVLAVATAVFDLVDFHQVGFDDWTNGHFQALTLRARGT